METGRIAGTRAPAQMGVCRSTGHRIAAAVHARTLVADDQLRSAARALGDDFRFREPETAVAAVKRGRCKPRQAALQPAVRLLRHAARPFRCGRVHRRRDPGKGLRSREGCAHAGGRYRRGRRLYLSPGRIRAGARSKLRRDARPGFGSEEWPPGGDDVSGKAPVSRAADANDRSRDRYRFHPRPVCLPR